MKEEHKLEIMLCGRVAASFRDEKDLMETAPARITEWNAMAKRHAEQAVQLALSIGAVLIAVRDRLPHGAFMAWVSTRCGSVSYSTARNYMRLAEAAIAQGGAQGSIGNGAEGGADGGGQPDARQPEGLIGDRSLTDLYREWGIVRREGDGNWGGRRKGAGRPAHDPAAEAVAAARDPDLCWAECCGLLKGLHEFGISQDGFGTLGDDDLETAVALLAEIDARAKAILASRKGGPK